MSNIDPPGRGTCASTKRTCRTPSATVPSARSPQGRRSCGHENGVGDVLVSERRHQILDVGVEPDRPVEEMRTITESGQGLDDDPVSRRTQAWRDEIPAPPAVEQNEGRSVHGRRPSYGLFARPDTVSLMDVRVTSRCSAIRLFTSSTFRAW